MSVFKTKVYDELGVDLDAEYTYRRLYGHAARILFVAFSGGSLRKGWRQWRHFIAQAVLVEQTQAAIVIQSSVRQWVAWLEVRQRRELRAQQQLYLEVLRRHEAARVNIAARRISKALQRHARLTREQRELRTLSACVVIQKVVRGRLARRWVHALWMWESWYATVIQTWVRRFVAGKRVRLMRKLHKVDERNINAALVRACSPNTP